MSCWCDVVVFFISHLYLSLALSYVLIISPAVTIVKQNIAQNSGIFKLKLCADFPLTNNCGCGIINNSAAARPHAAQPFYHIFYLLSIGKNKQKNRAGFMQPALSQFYYSNSRKTELSCSIPKTPRTLDNSSISSSSPVSMD